MLQKNTLEPTFLIVSVYLFRRDFNKWDDRVQGRIVKSLAIYYQIASLNGKTMSPPSRRKQGVCL